MEVLEDISIDGSGSRDIQPLTEPVTLESTNTMLKVISLQPSTFLFQGLLTNP